MGSQPAGRAARSIRVLVVDDNLDHVHTTAALLLEMGYDVDYAINGIVALDLARRNRPQVVLLDVNLPGWSGFEVARRFRRTPELRDVRIIGVTGAAVAREEALASGFDDLQRKPVDPRLLEALLAQT